MGELFENTIKPAFFCKLNPKTQPIYLVHINDVMRFCGKSFENISLDDAESYDRHLCRREENGEIKHTTHVTCISILRSLGSFIESCNFVDGYTNPFNSITVKAVDEVLSSSSLPSLDKVERLLAAGNDRDRLIFSLSAKCGLSTSEICSLKTSDLFTDEDGNMCGISVRKGRYTRNIKLPEDVLSLLTEYLPVLSLDSCDYLFLNRRNNPVKPRDLQRLLQKYLKELDIPSFTFEDLRHCAIVYMKAGGATDTDIADYLGIVVSGRIGVRYKKVAYDNMLTAADRSLVRLSGD